MAAPAEKTLKDLSGKWTLNSTLSESSDPVLKLQGIGYVVRTGIAYATITIDVKQYEATPKPPNDKSDDIVTHIDITQSASKLSNTQENRCLDNTFRDHTDWLFGSVKGRTTWVSADEVEDDFLKAGWLNEGDGKNLIMSHVESVDNGWIAQQIWGFRLLDKDRHYCRRIVLTKGTERAAIQLVYDWTP